MHARARKRRRKKREEKTLNKRVSSKREREKAETSEIGGLQSLVTLPMNLCKSPTLFFSLTANSIAWDVTREKEKKGRGGEMGELV